MTWPRRTLTLLALLAVGACGLSDSTVSDSSGKLTVMLTDAPAAFNAAVVTITQITLQGSGGTTVLSDTKTTTNLLSLSNDVTALVSDAVVQAGTYTELRFIISGGYVEVPDGGGGSTIYASSPTYEGLPSGAKVGGTLKMPSFAQSGLKVDLPGGAVTVGTGSNVLLVDFNVQQSFGHQAGNSGSWVMHPVVTASNFELSGSLNVALTLGTDVTLPSGLTLGSFDAVLTYPDGSTTKALQLAAIGGGAFGATYKYLVPGNYSLSVALDPSVTTTVSITTSPAIPAAVTVSAGAATQASFTITSAH